MNTVRRNPHLNYIGPSATYPNDSDDLGRMRVHQYEDFRTLSEVVNMVFLWNNHLAAG
jgi:hypothetical protein